MDCYLMLTVLIVTSCIFNSLCEAADTKADLSPKYQVKQVGEEGYLTCRSPDGYLDKYLGVTFIIQHNGKFRFSKSESDETQQQSLIANFNIPGLKKEDEGTYKCIIQAGNDVNVTAETKLFVIEGNQKHLIVKEGNSFAIDLIKPMSVEFVPVVKCTQEDKKICLFPSDGDARCHLEAKREHALKPITCQVTSKNAFEEYKGFDVKASTELQKTVSVVSWTKCTNTPCKLKAQVYGTIPVEVFWSLDGTNLTSTTERSDTVITSVTDYVNSTSAVVLLTVIGVGTVWSKNISAEQKDIRTGQNIELIVGIVAGCVGVIVVVLLVLFYIRYKGCGPWRQQNNTQSSEPEEFPLKKSKADNGQQ